jgi:hypothetical protein
MDYAGFKGDYEDEELANGPMGSTIREQKVNFIHHRTAYITTYNSRHSRQ